MRINFTEYDDTKEFTKALDEAVTQYYNTRQSEENENGTNLRKIKTVEDGNS